VIHDSRLAYEVDGAGGTGCAVEVLFCSMGMAPPLTHTAS
jgi:hypothetical protein